MIGLSLPFITLKCYFTDNYINFNNLHLKDKELESK